MDVSIAVDTLFAGVVPERVEELKALWGRQEERVRLLEANRFLLQQLYGTVQVSELALRQIWLIMRLGELLMPTTSRSPSQRYTTHLLISQLGTLFQFKRRRTMRSITVR